MGNVYKTSSGFVEQVKDVASKRIFGDIYNWISNMVSVSGIDPHVPAGVKGVNSLTPPPVVADVQVSIGHDVMTVLITPPVNVIGILYYLIETTQTLPFETSQTIESFGPTSSTIETFPLPLGAIALRVKAKFTNSDYGSGFLVQLPTIINYINVMDFGAIGDGVTDDSPAVQDAADYLKLQLHLVVTSPYTPNFYTSMLLFPSGHVFKLNTSIDLQLIVGQGWGIQMEGAMIIGSDAGYPIFDLLGSAYGFINGGIIIGDETSPPEYAFSTGRIHTAGQPAGGFFFNFVSINGHFNTACLLNSGSEGNTYLGPAWHNLISSTTCSILIDGYHHFTPVTRFTPSEYAVDTPDSCIQNEIINCDFNGSGNGHAVVICNADQIKISGYVVSLNDSGILLLGSAGRVFRDLIFHVHQETNTSTSNVKAQALSAGTIGVTGFELRDNFPEATVALLEQGTNVTDFHIYNGDIYSGLPVALKSGNVSFGTGVRFNGDYLKLSPYTPAGAIGTLVVYTVTGVPNNADGSNGDVVFRSDGGVGTTIYQRRAGAWVGVA